MFNEKRYKHICLRNNEKRLIFFLIINFFISSLEAARKLQKFIQAAQRRHARIRGSSDPWIADPCATVLMREPRRGSPSDTDDPRVAASLDVRKSTPKIRREYGRVICCRAHAQPLDHWRSIVGVGRAKSSRDQCALRRAIVHFVPSRRTAPVASARATRSMKKCLPAALREIQIPHNGIRAPSSRRSRRASVKTSTGNQTERAPRLVVLFRKRRVFARRDATN